MSTQNICLPRVFPSLLIVLGWCTLGFAAPAVEPADKTSPGLLDLPMEDLMKVEIASTAALTKTQARLVPAAVTTISREQIQGSSARSLFELLDIYVPNLQWARNNWEASNLGLRGIINDRDDKYLLLVNGRVMNEHTHYGAVTERDLVTLRDINHIDVIRGSGSALYGPGAISMVINIVTDNANTFEGTEVFTRAARLSSSPTSNSSMARNGRTVTAASSSTQAWVTIPGPPGTSRPKSTVSTSPTVPRLTTTPRRPCRVTD